METSCITGRRCERCLMHQLVEKDSSEVRIHESLEELSTDLADYIAELSEASVKERGFFAIALSGGSLIGLTVDWSKWYIFWADERVVGKNHVDSNYKLAKDHLLSKLEYATNMADWTSEISSFKKFATSLQKGFDTKQGNQETISCGSENHIEMAQPDNNNTLSSAFKTFFEREKLTGDNFNDWYRSLRIVLRVAGTYDYLFKPCPEEPPEDAAENVKAAWKAEYKIHSDVACLMLGRMSPALQRQFELYFPQAMLDELRRMFEKPKAVEIYDLVDTLHSCKQALGKSISAHVLEMKGYMDQLQALGKPYDNDMAINLINRSLNKDFGDFVRNFNMHCCRGRQDLEWKGSYPMESNTCMWEWCYKQLLKPMECVVSFSRLLGLGFVHTVTSNGISVSSNGIFYFSAISVELGSTYGLIHTDVCGPLRHVSRKGASYFLTFTDDFSRYGYVYLLKHKHEVFETFKVFKSEVELQLGKKIKALRSDRGGEYLSQEFKDYLDMVRSMFNLTTLSLSFWDYALGNMVPTKKVDKTHNEYGMAMMYYDYEIWQMDVKTAFLNGRLDEDIYMEQPEGYVNPRYPNRVCKLQRSIYGLKQASRQWNKRFDEEIKKFGFTQIVDEHVYIAID
ncbi:retrotransposon protein, putative, ty1-copia subclass [Tanacetum coccineum]